MIQASARFEQGKQALNLALAKANDTATKELIRGIFHFNYAVGLALNGIHEELQNLKKTR
jgi:hypothetical protein